MLLDGQHQEVQELQEHLEKINFNVLRHVPLSPLQKRTKVPFEAFSAPLKMRERLETKIWTFKSEKKTQYKEVKTPNDLLRVEGKPAENIYIIGEAGRGKTGQCYQLVHHWLQGREAQRNMCALTKWQKGLTAFDLLFLVTLRHVRKKCSSVVDMICNTVFKMYPQDHEIIRKILRGEIKTCKCLVVLDGLDEMKENIDIDVDISMCTIVMTMRPWKFDLLSPDINNRDKVVEVCGLDHRGMKKVIVKVLVNYFEMDKTTEEFTTTVERMLTKAGNKTLGSLMEIPLLLATSIHHWQSNSAIEESLTGFFAALVNLLIHIAFDNDRLSDNMKFEYLEQSLTTGCSPVILKKHKKLKKCLNILLALGKIAYRDLVLGAIKQVEPDDVSLQLVFDRDDLEEDLGSAVLTFALEVGLLSQTYAPGSYDEENVRINFFHKTVEEFLAAIYITCGNEVSIETFLQFINSLERVQELSNVLIFCIGIKPSLGEVLSNFIAETADSDIEIIRYRNTVDDKDFFVLHVFGTLRDCYREMKFSLSLDSQTEYSEDMYRISDVVIDYITCNETEILEAYEMTRKLHKNIVSLYIITPISEHYYPRVPHTFITKCLSNLHTLKILHIAALCDFRKIVPLFSSLSVLSLEYAIIRDICCFQEALKSNTQLLTLKLKCITVVGSYIYLNLENNKTLQILEIENNLELSTLNILNVQLVDITECTQLTTLVLNGVHVPNVSTIQSALSSFMQLQKLEICALYCLDKLYLNITKCKLLSELILGDVLIGDIKISPVSLSSLTVKWITGSLRGLLHVLPKCRHLNEIKIMSLDIESSVLITQWTGWRHVMAYRFRNIPEYILDLQPLPMSYDYIKPFLLAYADGMQNTRVLSEILPRLTSIQSIFFCGHYTIREKRVYEKESEEDSVDDDEFRELANKKDHEENEYTETHDNRVKDIAQDDTEETGCSSDDSGDTDRTSEDNSSDESSSDDYADDDLEDGSNDAMVAQVVAQMANIRTITLQRIDMREHPLTLLPCMDKLVSVWFLHVIMSAEGWNKFITSVLNVRHAFEIELSGTNIDDDSVSFVQSSPQFKVIEKRLRRRKISHERQGKYMTFKFSRLKTT